MKSDIEFGVEYGGGGATVRTIELSHDGRDVRCLRLTSRYGGRLKRPQEVVFIPLKHFEDGDMRRV